jgi:HTH-type transcriptional regulator, glycine betaine synthesis regulator
MSRASSKPPRAPSARTEASDAPGASDRSLWKSEIIVTDLIGRLIEFWGFKRNMGRVWAILYMSPDPMSAADIRSALRLSTGAVSMTISELDRWGVIKRVWVPGERRDYFTAEVQIWKMISRVMAEREGGEIAAAIESCERALASLEPHLSSPEPEERARARLQEVRINALVQVARLGRHLLDMLLSTAKLDAEPLSRIELTRD